MPILRLTPLVVLLLCLFQQNSLSAQDKLNIKFGKVKPADFDVQSPLIDSNTNAVVVADVGKSSFVANTNELTFSLVYTQKKRIKIINKNGFDAATITIPLYVIIAMLQKNWSTSKLTPTILKMAKWWKIRLKNLQYLLRSIVKTGFTKSLLSPCSRKEVSLNIPTK